MKYVSLLTVFALAASAAGAAAAQDPSQPVVTVYRVPEADTTTIVEGVFRVDAALLGTGTCDYAAEVSVRDAQGLGLFEDKWDASCPSANGVQLPALEVFHFAMPAGSTFNVTVAVSPKGKPAERHVKTIRVVALPAYTMASDLILAKQVGFVDSASSRKWTLRRGTIGIQTSSEAIIEPDSAQVAYYFELYPRRGKPVTGSVTGIVRQQDGKDVTRFPLTQLNAVADPRPIAGTVKLDGLAPGSYRFDVEVALADTTLRLSHPFQMASPALASYWESVSDQDLEEVYGSIVTWITRKADADLYNTLSPAGKRAFLGRFFNGENPTPNDGEESAIDAFVERSKVVHDRYAERAGRGSQAGWLTDRGRIYMLHGLPTRIVTKQSPVNGQPYEIFYYASGRGNVYLFADETGMRHYRLVYSNDPSEPESQVLETTKVGNDALVDLQRLGATVRIKQE